MARGIDKIFIEEFDHLRSQFVTSSTGWGSPYLPYGSLSMA